MSLAFLDWGMSCAPTRKDVRMGGKPQPLRTKNIGLYQCTDIYAVNINAAASTP